jgi:hypothetical protein
MAVYSREEIIAVGDKVEEPICTVCGDSMLPGLPLSAAVAEVTTVRRSGAASSSLDPLRRAVACPGGHVFCGDCWAGHSSVQVLRFCICKSFDHQFVFRYPRTELVFCNAQDTNATNALMTIGPKCCLLIVKQTRQGGLYWCPDC